VCAAYDGNPPAAFGLSIRLDPGFLEEAVESVEAAAPA
jgi:hypothetical protein